MLIRSDPRQRDGCQPYDFSRYGWKGSRLLRNKDHSLMCQYTDAALQFWQRNTVQYIKLKTMSFIKGHSN